MDIEEVQRRAKAGPVALLIRRALALLLSLVSTITIPHLVSPRAYGLSAMSAVILSLADMFKDFGLTTALMRKGHIEPEEVNFLFWFNTASTVLLTLALAAIAPLAGLFFHERVVTWVILASLVSFMAGGLTLQHRALLSRDLRFSLLAAIDTGAAVLQLSVTLVAALMHFDVWSIVLGNICLGLFTATACVIASGWRPGRPSWAAEAAAILRFGANASAFSLAIFISNNITPILFGRFLGPLATGQYNRANAIMIMPQANGVEPIAQAALPVLARLRPFPDVYRKAYLTLLERLNILVVPASAVLLCCGDLLVRIVLGERWALAGQLLQCLAPVVGMVGFGYAVGDLFVSQDRSSELRNLGFLDLGLRPLAVAIGITLGPLSAAIAYSLASFVISAARMMAAGRKGPVNVADHLKTLTPSLHVAGGILICSCAARLLAGYLALAPFWTLAVTLGAAVAAALVSSFSVASSRRVVFGILILFKIPYVSRLAGFWQVPIDV